MNTPRNWMMALATAGMLASLVAVGLYLDADVVCGSGSCEQLVGSPYSSILGLPAPLFSFGFFAVVLAVATRDDPTVWRTLTVVAGLGLAASLWLLAVMVRRGHLCPYCAAVHAVVIAVAGLAFAQVWRHDQPWVRTMAPLAGTALVMTVAVGAAFYCLRPLPTVGRARGAVVAYGPSAWNPSARSSGIAVIDPSCPHCAAAWPAWAARHNLQVALQPSDEQCASLAREVDGAFPAPDPAHMRIGACRAGAHAFCAAQQGRAGSFLAVLFADVGRDGTGAVATMTSTDYLRIARRAGLDVAGQVECTGDRSTDWTPAAMPPRIRHWFAVHLVDAARVRRNHDVPYLIVTAGEKA